ncbi:MAG: 3-ketoacyl-ACP reductase [Kurthia sp.]|nr:3-ketoacyl-ACP reductase [Candidatus Kurthia equi]
MGQSLNGKVAIVTGAARGIGKAVAIELAKQRVNVGIIAKTEESLIEMKARLLDLGVKAEYAVADVSKLDEVEAAIKKLNDSIGTADILINNAGIGGFTKLVDSDPLEWKRIIDVNLMGTYNVTRTVLPQLIEKNKGDIINISSTNGLNGAPGSSAYSASKFGVIGLTESVAQEVRRNNIRVSALTPSTIVTDLAAGSDLLDENKIDQYIHPIDIAEYIISQLKLDNRVYIKNATLIGTNPF